MWNSNLGPTILEWVIGTDEAKAEKAWDHHNHKIRINGIEISDLESYTHEVTHYTVSCPDETLEIRAKGLSIYLPPMPEGEYEIQWYSEITREFDDGWVVYKPGNFMAFNVKLKVQGEEYYGSNIEYWDWDKRSDFWKETSNE